MKTAAPGRDIFIACAADENYAPYLSAMLESLADTLSDSCTAHVTVMHSGLSAQTRRALCESSVSGMEVRCLDVSDMILPYRDVLYSTGYLTEGMYYRALLPKIFSGGERVLYLDCDIILLADVSELYFTDMGDSPVMGAQNPMHPRMRAYVESIGLDPAEYINSGVLLLDCAALAELNFTERFFALAQRLGELRFPDQDLINLLLRGRIAHIPPEWNYLWHMERLGRSDNPELRMPAAELARYTELYGVARIIHFSGDMKPWVFDALRGAEHFARYAERCPMHERIAERRSAALAGKECVRLLFFDFEGSFASVTCAHVLPRALPSKALAYSLGGEEYLPEPYLEHEISSQGILTVRRIFKVRIPLTESSSLGFSLGGEPVSFGCGAFFPLNELPESYFACRGVIVYREGYELRVRSCTGGERASRERSYLRALWRRRTVRARKYFLLRLMHPMLRRLLPRHAWLISDRPEVAGDNGEALFMYLTEHAPNGVRPYFVIRRDSADFRRLGKLGRVVAAGSLYHKLLSLVAEVKAVSHTDRELYFPTDSEYVKDILYPQKRVFLQHGITKDDISGAYSRFNHGFDLFITAAYPEYFSIIENPRYGLDPRHVALTGFSRHDLLRCERERLILVCPTWRSYLLPGGKPDPELFRASRYFSAWQSLLSAGALPAVASRFGYRVVFLPHRNTEPYIHLFDGISPEVSIASGGYSELISRASLMLTDYSSVAFEMGYLRKPVLYYLFDEREFFSRHTYSEGYFEPARDGFGDVFGEESELLSAVGELLSSGCRLSRDALLRAEGFFAYGGGGNSGRVTDAIMRTLAEGEK